MKKLFRRTELKGPKYPSHEAAGLSGRTMVAAGLIVATAAGGLFQAGCSGTAEEPDFYARDAGRDAAYFMPDTGGAPPYPDAPDASQEDAAVPDDAGGVPPAPDAGE